MSGALEVLQPGVGCTVQDAGRPGHRHHGLPLAGWLDGPLARAAHALLDNPPKAALLELRGNGTHLCVSGAAVRVALSGDIGAQRLSEDGEATPLPAWRSHTLMPGEQLLIGPARSGCAYLAMAGGLAVPAAFGSRSSDGRAGLPGLLGRPLRPGDVLPAGPQASSAANAWRSAVWGQETGPVRVIPGPQAGHFSAQAWAAFFEQDWQATRAQDRMGLRLQGQALVHASATAAEIVSDGVAPGAIQVPADGQPIVLLADGQTVGGYPKIATVITADLPRLAHLPPGTRVRFAAVTPAQAREALLAQHRRWHDWLATRRPALPDHGVDDAALYASNLISGMLGSHPDEDTP